MKGQGLTIRKKSKNQNTNMHRFSIPELIEKIVQQADIILETLDARFIEKTRNFEIEKEIKSLKKPIIFLLNKSDLVDTDRMAANLELNELEPYVFFSCKNKKGAEELKEMIRLEAKKLAKYPVNLGIIGYPNTGKSSVINILSGKSCAKTSPEAGYTKGIQKIKLSPGLYLIDTPGIIPLNENSIINREHLIKHTEIGVRTWDKTKEPELVVSRLVREYPGVIEEHYRINAAGNAEEIIEKLGRKLSYLKKGNLVDTDRTARRILKDWQEGRIRV